MGPFRKTGAGHAKTPIFAMTWQRRGWPSTGPTGPDRPTAITITLYSGPTQPASNISAWHGADAARSGSARTAAGRGPLWADGSESERPAGPAPG